MRHPSRVRAAQQAFALVPFLVVLTAPRLPVQSATRATLVARLDSLAGAPVHEGRAVGISVAVVKGTDTLLLLTTAAVLQLRDEGKLDLDADITKYLPTYPTHGRDDQRSARALSQARQGDGTGG
jgi:CubicO group peptidase (beta-lactamase class C family)